MRPAFCGFGLGFFESVFCRLHPFQHLLQLRRHAVQLRRHAVQLLRDAVQLHPVSFPPVSATKHRTPSTLENFLPFGSSSPRNGLTTLRHAS